MSDIQLYLLEVDKNKAEARKIASQSASKLESKQLKLIDLITSLEEYINNKNDGAIRAKSVAYLADCLESLPQKVLSGQERRLLSDFTLGRIEGDTEGIGASARILIALEERGKWDHDTAQRVTTTFLDHASPLKDFKLQTDRFAVIQLFDLLVGKYRKPLKELHDGDSEFLSKFIYFFDGEKDPRNLMIVFSILQVPMTEWEVKAYAHELFDAVFNYFPITFKPPPDDPYGITAQDLKDRLRECIAANSDFAPYCFPALLDKLDSTSMNTKRDVLHTTQSCVTSYDSTTISLFSGTLWDALKFEILNVQEEDLADGALKVLTLIAGKFAQQEGLLNAYLKPLIKECNNYLEDAPTKQSAAAGRILHAVATAATPVADKIAKGIIPTIFTLYQASESMTKRRGLLEVFNDIVRAYLDRFRLQPKLSLEGLTDFGSDASGMMLRAIVNAPKAEVSFRLAALSGIAQLVALRGLLTEEQTSQAVDVVTEIILHELVAGHGDIKAEAMKTLTEMARSSPDAVRNRAIPSFIVELPDNPENSSSVMPVLGAFAELSSEQQVFDTIVLRLKNKHSAARAAGSSPDYQEALLLAILYAFTHGSPMPDEEGIVRSNYYSDFVEPLASRIDETNDTQMPVEIVGRLCNIILRPQGVHFQSQMYNKNREPPEADGLPDKAALAKVQSSPSFSLYYYAALRPEVIEAEDVIALLQVQANTALNATADNGSLPFVLQHISLIVNKFINPKAMQAALENAKIEIDQLLSEPQFPPNATTIAFAVVKALLVQGKCPALTTKYLQLLLNLLSSLDGKSVAKRFGNLLALDEILTKENHCQVSGLYKQKTFNQLVPSLTTAIRTTDPSTKPNYLIALSGILRWLPYSILASSLSMLIPPLLQTLDLPSLADQEAKSSTLTIFESVLMYDPDALNEHTASLISRLLNCTVAPGNSAKVRVKALQCLALVPQQLKRENVVPLRRQVVKRLVSSLDDGKREVRAEGVRCRSKWLGLDDEADEE